VWRVLYDDQFLYLSCEYFDDYHFEGDAALGWESTDAAELSFLDPLISLQDIKANVKGPVSKARFFRKFSEKSGVAYEIACFSATSGNDTLISGVAEEGSPLVLGMVCKALPITDPGILKNCSAPWFLEIRIPLANLSKSSLGASELLRMNLKVHDAEKNSQKYPVSAAGLDRYPLWQNFVVAGTAETLSIKDSVIMPAFVFSDARVLAKSAVNTVAWPLPDEKNLYCGNSWLGTYQPKSEALFSRTPFTRIETLVPTSYLVSGIAAIPNPTTPSGVVRLSAPFSGPIRWTIFSSTGALVYLADKSEPFVWDFKSNGGRVLAQGTYMVKAQGLGQSATRTIIIQK